MSTSVSRAIASLGCIAAFLAVLLPERGYTHGSITTTVLFDREIVGVLNRHCVMYHTGNGPSFPLTTYDETWVRGRAIRTALLRRHMPPWSAVAGYGEFLNDNSLTPRETQFVVSWVEGLGPRNAGTVFLNVPGGGTPTADVRAAAHTGHWQRGEPDLVRPIEPQQVPANQVTIARTVVETGLTVTRRVAAIEFMPGDARVVRSVTFTVQETGQWLGSWTPWYRSIVLPAGVAYGLPPGSHIAAEIHYRGARDATTDRSSLGLFFDETNATAAPDDLVMNALPVQSRATASKLSATTRLTRESRIWALQPEVPAETRSIEVTARRQDGNTNVLLFARDPSAEWQTPYFLKTPVVLPRGTQITLTAHVDDARVRSLRLRIGRY